MWCARRSRPMRCAIRRPGGKIFAGLTRVVWELEEVKAGQGRHFVSERVAQVPFQLWWTGPLPTQHP